MVIFKLNLLINKLTNKPKFIIMRKQIFITLMALGFAFATNSQSQLIIDWDFSDWDESAGIVSDPATECESFDHLIDTLRTSVKLESGTDEIGVQLTDYAISPNCSCKKFNRDGLDCGTGISTGFVSLSKIREAATEPDPDTIGSMVLSKFVHVDSVVFGFSCTGDGRGIYLYTSVDDGETWVQVGDEHYSSNAQFGEVMRETIDLDTVMIKFTSGIKESDATSQNSRIHNLKVYGTPEVIAPPVSVTNINQPNINIYLIPESGLLMVNGKVNAVNVYNTLGKLVQSAKGIENSTINVSNLPSSLYIVEAFDNNNNRIVKKIIK